MNVNEFEEGMLCQDGNGDYCVVADPDVMISYKYKRDTNRVYCQYPDDLKYLWAVLPEFLGVMGFGYVDKKYMLQVMAYWEQEEHEYTDVETPLNDLAPVGTKVTVDGSRYFKGVVLLSQPDAAWIGWYRENNYQGTYRYRWSDMSGYEFSAVAVREERQPTPSKNCTVCGSKSTAGVCAACEDEIFSVVA